MINKRIILLSAIVLAAPCAHATTINGVCYGNPSPSIPAGTFDPNDPGKSGYSLVFDSEFNNLNDVDMSCPNPPSSTGCTDPAGKNWYLNTWTFPNTVTNPRTDINIEAPPYKSNKTTVLHIHQSQINGNWAMSTMGPSAGASNGSAPWQRGWNGKVFTGGWYVEGRFSTEWQACSSGSPCIANGTVVTAPPVDAGHASIWSYAMDYLADGARLFAEDDLMDGVYGTAFYLTNLIAWNGPGGIGTTATTGTQCINPSNNLVNITCGGFPNNFQDRTHVHIYGQLWVPATSTTQGYVQQYFDGVPMGKFTWNQYVSGQTTNPGVMDINHMQVNIGNDPRHSGDATAATSTSWWDWVHVWQLPVAATASGNNAVLPQANFTGGNQSCMNTSPPPPPPPSSLPDLVPTTLTYNSSNSLFTSVIKNEGAGATPVATIGVAYLVDGTKCTWGAVDNISLAPGASVTIGTEGGACPISNGTHTISVIADDVDRIQMSTRTNDTLSETITVGPPLPDLVPTALTYNTANGSFTSIIKNEGNGSTPVATIGVAYLVDGVKCTWGAVDNTALASGASVTIGSQGGVCRIPSGSHTISVIADDVDRIVMSTRANDTLTETIQIP
jgi:hypothetical protein